VTEREVWRDPYRAQRITVEPLPPHGLLDLYVEEDGLATSARLDPDAARRLRDTLDGWLREEEGCPPPATVVPSPVVVEVRSPEFTRYGVPEHGWVVVSAFVDAVLHDQGIVHEHRLPSANQDQSMPD
jgi:hypothetical protein